MSEETREEALEHAVYDALKMMDPSQYDSASAAILRGVLTNRRYIVAIEELADFYKAAAAAKEKL
jgi:hypothetical protein